MRARLRAGTLSGLAPLSPLSLHFRSADYPRPQTLVTTRDLRVRRLPPGCRRALFVRARQGDRAQAEGLRDAGAPRPELRPPADQAGADVGAVARCRGRRDEPEPQRV